MKFQEKYENYLRKKALKMLEQMLGQGKAIVTVNASLNFDQIERSMKQYTPPVKGEDSGVLESRKSEMETYEGKGPKPNGVPGTESNTNPSYQRADQSDGSKYSRSNDINNFLYNELSEHHIPSGGIEKLTVAVVLDEDIDLETNKKYNNFTDTDLETFKNLVGAAVGLDTSRGDSITVHSRPFDKREQQRIKKEFEKIEFKEQLRFWVPVIMVIIIFVILPSIYWLIKKHREHKERLRKKEEERRKRADRIKKIEPPVSLEEQELLDVQEKVRQAAIENPDQFADLLRIWLSENE
jgi:flagellar M-ring protein FliF